MKRSEIRILGIGIALLVLLFVVFWLCGLLELSNTIDTSQLIQIIVTFVLVLVTVAYVKRTAEIADATRKQADASVKMAEETREQRYSESLPLLVPDITRRGVIDQKLEPNEVDYQTLQTGVGIEVTWHNFGRGMAINTRFSFYSAPLDSHPGKVLFFPPRELEALEVGGRKEIKFGETCSGQLGDIPEAYFPRLEAEYQDIYERIVTSIQEFRIEEQNKNKRAFLGDLYFKVNDRRLGTEAEHD